MKTTAILHATATGFVGGGIFLSEGSLSIGLLAVGMVLFVAGIVAARRGESGPPDAT